jgi:hypothetical protein
MLLMPAHLCTCVVQVLIEGCQRVVVLFDGIEHKLVVSGCDQVRSTGLAHAGPVCSLLLIRSTITPFPNS